MSAADHSIGGGGTRMLVVLVAAPVVALVSVTLGLILLLGGATAGSCDPGAPLPGDLDAPGSLGHVAGTGLTRSQIRGVRLGSVFAGDRLTPGRYVTTSYGPPWGGIQGAGLMTSGGLAIGGAAPRWYSIAVDPQLIAHGRLVYLWPNPFGWRGPFLAADTGSAIRGRRIDFYDWRGRTDQHRWGERRVRVSARPLHPGAPEAGADLGSPAGCEAQDTSGAGGVTGERIGKIARSHLGSGPRIDGFEPEAVGYAWCAWFATNVWRRAGVHIPVNGWSGFPYQWARARGLLFKAVGQAPRGATPPVGAALMYGTTPRPGGDSRHINLVDAVNPDGSFMVTGGNQDGSRVTRYGPCRLRRTDPATLVGPGCDPRPVYGIATPTRN